MPKKPAKDYQQLGQMMVNIYESGYIDRNQSYKMSFLKGLVGGLGGVIGATIVVALLLAVLSIFKEFDPLRPIVERVIDIIRTKQP